MIFYWSEQYVAGDERGRRYATIRDIDPNRDPPLRLDNMECLDMYHLVSRHKILQPDGTLLDNEDGKVGWIREFKLKKSKPAPYRMSTEGARLGALWSGLTDQYMAVAEEQGMPQDLMCRTTAVQQDAVVSSTDYDDSGTEMSSEQPSDDHVMDKENIGNG